ncbi:MAG: PIG-L deacetylase family protein [Marinilabiliaceae bacterium]|jgi:LmbE family N-acetylglucosaminyl deacetylase|nr:PIG-L deacetylase family protein [Marinilabiliaceae bacterium]
MNKKVLIIAAHPDDEVLGCGGTVAKLVKDGYEAASLVLGEGKTSRSEGDNIDYSEEISALNDELVKANKILGISKTFTHNFPDNCFDSVPLLDVIKVIEKVKTDFQPDIVFTHFEEDTNIDHRIVYNAVLAATRPMVNETVREIYSFEVLSSTEWRFPLKFSPDMFFDISETIEIKTQAMAAYQSELRAYPHPRSLEFIEMNAKNWGVKTGLNYAEAFKTVRCIKKTI